MEKSISKIIDNLKRGEGQPCPARASSYTIGMSVGGTEKFVEMLLEGYRRRKERNSSFRKFSEQQKLGSCPTQPIVPCPELCEETLMNQEKLRRDIEKMRESMKLTEEQQKKLEENDTKKAIVCSNSALAFYNRANGMNFELVEPVGWQDSRWYCKVDGQHGEPVHRFWTHLNFLAKQPRDDATPMLFFAELIGPECVMNCSIVFPQDTANYKGCGFCHPELEIFHPAGKFHAGQGPYMPRYHALGGVFG